MKQIRSHFLYKLVVEGGKLNATSVLSVWSEFVVGGRK